MTKKLTRGQASLSDRELAIVSGGARNNGLGGKKEIEKVFKRMAKKKRELPSEAARRASKS